MTLYSPLPGLMGSLLTCRKVPHTISDHFSRMQGDTGP